MSGSYGPAFHVNYARPWDFLQGRDLSQKFENCILRTHLTPEEHMETEEEDLEKSKYKLLLTHLEACAEVLLVLSASQVNQTVLCSSVIAWLVTKERMAGEDQVILEKMQEDASAAYRSSCVLKVVIDKWLPAMCGGQYHWENTDDSKENKFGRPADDTADVPASTDGLPAVCPREAVDGQEPKVDLSGDRAVRRRAARPKGKRGGGG
jgi:hypothetical protein